MNYVFHRITLVLSCATFILLSSFQQSPAFFSFKKFAAMEPQPEMDDATKLQIRKLLPVFKKSKLITDTATSDDLARKISPGVNFDFDTVNQQLNKLVLAKLVKDEPQGGTERTADDLANQEALEDMYNLYYFFFENYITHKDIPEAARARILHTMPDIYDFGITNAEGKLIDAPLRHPMTRLLLEIFKLNQEQRDIAVIEAAAIKRAKLFEALKLFKAKATATVNEYTSRGVKAADGLNQKLHNFVIAIQQNALEINIYADWIKKAKYAAGVVIPAFLAYQAWSLYRGGALEQIRDILKNTSELAERAKPAAAEAYKKANETLERTNRLLADLEAKGVVEKTNIAVERTNALLADIEAKKLAEKINTGVEKTTAAVEAVNAALKEAKDTKLVENVATAAARTGQTATGLQDTAIGRVFIGKSPHQELKENIGFLIKKANEHPAFAKEFAIKIKKLNDDQSLIDASSATFEAEQKLFEEIRTALYSYLKKELIDAWNANAELFGKYKTALNKMSLFDSTRYYDALAKLIQELTPKQQYSLEDRQNINQAREYFAKLLAKANEEATKEKAAEAAAKKKREDEEAAAKKKREDKAAADLKALNVRETEALIIRIDQFLRQIQKFPQFKTEQNASLASLQKFLPKSETSLVKQYTAKPELPSDQRTAAQKLLDECQNAFQEYLKRTKAAEEAAAKANAEATRKRLVESFPAFEAQLNTLIENRAGSFVAYWNANKKVFSDNKNDLIGDSFFASPEGAYTDLEKAMAAISSFDLKYENTDAGRAGVLSKINSAINDARDKLKSARDELRNHKKDNLLTGKLPEVPE